MESIDKGWLKLLAQLEAKRHLLNTAQEDFDAKLADHRAQIEEEHEELLEVVEDYQLTALEAHGWLAYQILRVEAHRRRRGSRWLALLDSWLGNMRGALSVLAAVVDYREPDVDVPEHHCEVPTHRNRSDVERMSTSAADHVGLLLSHPHAVEGQLGVECQELRDHYEHKLVEEQARELAATTLATVTAGREVK